MPYPRKFVSRGRGEKRKRVSGITHVKGRRREEPANGPERKYHFKMKEEGRGE